MGPNLRIRIGCGAAAKGRMSGYRVRVTLPAALSPAIGEGRMTDNVARRVGLRGFGRLLVARG